MNTKPNGQPLDVETPVEGLVQTYQNPAGKAVPPGVAIIMLRDGTFWDGGTTGTGSPVTESEVLVPDTPIAVIVDTEQLNGCRILNWSSFPIYLSQDATPEQGPPSDFIPPGSMDDDGNVWPAQYNFDFSPSGNWFLLCPGDAEISVIKW